MGAPTSTRKRSGRDSITFNYFASPYNTTLESRFDLQISKKPKLSPMSFVPDPPVSSISTQSTFSRVHEYPKPRKGITRELHAPRPNQRFSKCSSIMGGLFSKYPQKKDAAFNTFWCSRKDKEKEKEKEKPVIDVEEESYEDLVICGDDDDYDDDSNMEEVQVLGRKGIIRDERYVGLSQKDTDTDELKEKYKKLTDNHLQGSSSGVSDLSIQTPKASTVEKKMGLLSLNRAVEEMSVPPHKRLYEPAQGINKKLERILFDIKYLLNKLSFFKKPTKTSQEELCHELFVPLTDKDEAEVSRAFSNSYRRKVLVTHDDSSIEITGEVLQCLRPGAWLNDEVINLYLELLKEREKREPEKYLQCHFFNTFFYKKLLSGKGGYDYKAVRRWTTPRKIGYDLIDCDKIFVPIHREIHWCLAVINKKDKKFQYLDSLKGTDSKVLQNLARYYADEVKDKSAKDIDVKSWELEYVDDLPEQKNGFDCGMFMIKYADFYSRGLGLCFGQKDMPYFRKRTAKEILKKKAE